MEESQAIELTDKQRVFVEEYLQCWNATEAARRAGYGGSEGTLRSIASENLTKPNIQAYVQQRMREKAMGADEVLARLADVARGSLAEFITFSRRGVPKLDLKKAEEAGKLHLLKSYSKGKYGTNVELYSSLEALQFIGKHLKLFVDRTELTGENGGPIQIEQIDKALKKIYGDHGNG